MRARFDFLADGRPVQCDALVARLEARTVADVGPVMAAAEQALRDGFHIAGWVGYEAAAAFDPALVTQSAGAMPLVCFGVFRELRHVDPLVAPDEAGASAIEWTPQLSRDAHRDSVATIREAIADGETYQINYTFRLHADLSGLRSPGAGFRSPGASAPGLSRGLKPACSISDLYAQLSSAEQVPYAALVETDEWSVLSLSPELFFHRDGDRLVTKPMKGTAPRGRWEEEDVAMGESLRTSAKNRAENVMIVDLCRNDLTRVCQVGSVQATSMFDVHRYPTVWQMVSTVEGTLRPDATLTDIFRALFPAGSITGAPKSSSMRLIAGLEHAPRGVYCGAVGYASPDGRATFNVGIRTIAVHRPSGRAEYGVGGGITWDSTAADEHAEAMQKAACLEVRPPFSLIETLRYENGAYVRLEGHLARLQASADYFGFHPPILPVAHLQTQTEPKGFSPWDNTRAEARVLRVRWLLSRNGELTVTFEPIDPTPERPSITLASSPVDSSNRWLFHKTTRREVYDRHKAEHPDVWDVLLWNERRELTEFTRGNVVLELDGRLVTPARGCGLLAGIFRQHLLESGQVVEAIVSVDELQKATRLWFVNSLREWVECGTRRSR